MDVNLTAIQESPPEKYNPNSGGGERAAAFWRQMMSDFGPAAVANKWGKAPPENWRVELDRIPAHEWERAQKSYLDGRLESTKKGFLPNLRELIAAGKDDSQERVKWGKTTWKWQGLDCKHPKVPDFQKCVGEKCKIFDTSSQCKYAQTLMIGDGLQIVGWRESGAKDSAQWRKALAAVMKKINANEISMPYAGGKVWSTGRYSQEWIDCLNANVMDEIGIMKDAKLEWIDVSGGEEYPDDAHEAEVGEWTVENDLQSVAVELGENNYDVSGFEGDFNNGEPFFVVEFFRDGKSLGLFGCCSWTDVSFTGMSVDREWAEKNL